MENNPDWQYHGKQFKSVSNSSSGEVSEETIFYYQQNGQAISARYEGGGIKQGNLLGNVDADGTLSFCYQHWNTDDEFRTGICTSKPEILSNGKIRLHETWEWTNGKVGKGKSIIEEI